MAKLAAGYNIVIKQKVGNTNTPLYPFTAVENVFDKDGNSLATLLSGITGQNFVPDYSGETTSNLRFLRNDNTWADIQAATTSQAGVAGKKLSITMYAPMAAPLNAFFDRRVQETMCLKTHGTRHPRPLRPLPGTRYVFDEAYISQYKNVEVHINRRCQAADVDAQMTNLY
jgi:hypothetical protein